MSVLLALGDVEKSSSGTLWLAVVWSGVWVT